MALFSWILEEKFSKKPALQHFTEKSSKNLEMMCHFFTVTKTDSSKLVKVFFPQNVEDSETLLFTYSHLNAKWGLDFFSMVDANLNRDQIVERAATALPTVHLTGM